MSSRFRIALNRHLLDDAKREALLTGILKVAPSSPLAQIPGIAASLAALNTKGAAFTANIAAVASANKVFKSATTQRDLSRDAFDSEVVTLKTLTENYATNPGDLTGMGFTMLDGASQQVGPLSPPSSLLVKTGNVHGRASVSVAGKGYQGQFAAQVSTDPIGNWATLPGSGKSRKLTGYASGTKLWVQFARVRNGMQSAWSTPVLVTIP